MDGTTKRKEQTCDPKSRKISGYQRHCSPVKENRKLLMEIGRSFCLRYDRLMDEFKTIQNDPYKKRKLTQLNNDPQYNEHSFLVQHGMTLGEYDLLYFLIHSDNRKKYQQKSTQKSTQKQSNTQKALQQG